MLAYFDQGNYPHVLSSSASTFSFGFILMLFLAQGVL